MIRITCTRAEEVALGLWDDDEQSHASARERERIAHWRSILVRAARAEARRSDAPTDGAESTGQARP